MAKIVVKGNDAEEIVRALNKGEQRWDIKLHFRRKLYSAFPVVLLPGLEVNVCHDKYQSREHLTLEDAIKHIRKIYREAHEQSKRDARSPRVPT